MRKIILTLLISSSFLFAAEMDWAAEMRAKFYYSETLADFYNDNGQSTYLRTRLAFRMSQDWLSGLVQLQDSRRLGDNINASGSIAEMKSAWFGLHQVVMSIDQLLYPGYRFDIGRFEQNLGGQRLFSSNNWNENGRSFDGWRLVRSGKKYLTGQIFYLYSSPPMYSSYNVNTTITGASLAPLGGKKPSNSSVLELYGYQNAGVSSTAFRRTTIGTRLGFQLFIVEFELEAARQTGKIEDREVDASMAVFNLGINTGFIPVIKRLAVGREYFSGDEPSTGTLEGFANPFGAGHKYHGHFDRFKFFPENTLSGLNEWNVKLDLNLRPGMLTRVAYHNFSEGTKAAAFLGEEINIEHRQKIGPSGWITAGFARHRYGGGDSSDIAYTVFTIRL